jgi:hypothetical protein
LSLKQNILKKSEAHRNKIQTLDHQTKASLNDLEKREVTIQGSVEIILEKVEAALTAFRRASQEDENRDGLLLSLKSFCLKMDALGFWSFITGKKKELDALKAQMPLALAECVDLPRFVLESILEVFPVDKRVEKSDIVNNLGWACVLVLKSLIPMVVDPMIGKSRLLVMPSMKKLAKEIAGMWKAGLEERRGIENVKTDLQAC